MEKLFQMAWSLPFLGLLACVPLYYSFNLNQEYNQIRIFSRQYFDRPDRSWEGRRELGECLLEHLPAALGRGNLFFMAACLTLGGVGSLLWMAVASTACILLRFLRVMAYFHQVADEPHCGPIEGLDAFFRKTVGERMHFGCGAGLGWVWSGIGLIIGLLPLSNYFTAKAIWDGEQSFWPLAAGAALLFAGGFAILTARGGKGFGVKTQRVFLWSYLLLLLFLLLKNWNLIFMAAAAIVTDGFQRNWFAGPMLGKGWGMTMACGVCLCCWNAGLFHEGADRRFAVCAWKARASAAEAGFWAMLDGLAGIVLAGGLCGILAAVYGISQTGPHVNGALHMVGKLSGGSGPLILLFCFLSVWIGWRSCREESENLIAGIHQIFKRNGRSSLFSGMLYPLVGLAVTAALYLWDKAAPGQLHWLCLLFLLLFPIVGLQVIMAVAVSSHTSEQLGNYQKRYWKKGLG